MLCCFQDSCCSKMLQEHLKYDKEREEKRNPLCFNWKVVFTAEEMLESEEKAASYVMRNVICRDGDWLTHSLNLRCDGFCWVRSFLDLWPTCDFPTELSDAHGDGLPLKGVEESPGIKPAFVLQPCTTGKTQNSRRSPRLCTRPPSFHNLPPTSLSHLPWFQYPIPQIRWRHSSLFINQTKLHTSSYLPHILPVWTEILVLFQFTATQQQ